MLTVNENFRWLRVTRFWLSEENYSKRKLTLTKIKTDKIFPNKISNCIES